MSPEQLLSAFMCMFCCLLVSYACGSLEEYESRVTIPQGNRPRYGGHTPYINLLAFFILLPLIYGFGVGWEYAFVRFTTWGLATFLQISLFYALLILLTPLLRRYFSARSCACLWLLPGWLYFIAYDWFVPTEPLAVLCLPRRLVNLLIPLWLAGFLGVLGWHILSHLRFRREILRDAVPVTAPVSLAAWDMERSFANVRYNYQVVTSPAVTTPLSIGLSKRTIRVVLPQRSYTKEELRLIFRHELVHICRWDSGNKFCLLFCTAVCWFNPLMWRAMKTCAEEMELSCDETVLLHGDDAQRRAYADLILRTAGDGRGFTTCLAAGARSLGYRLGQIVKRRKVINGGWLLGLVLFPLMMTSGLVVMAYDQGTAGDIIFPADARQEEYILRHINYGDPDQYELSSYDCTDPEGLRAYLAGLACSMLASDSPFPNSDHELDLRLSHRTGTVFVQLRDRTMIISGFNGDSTISHRYYYLPQSPDWDYIQSVLDDQVNRGEHLPPIPELTLTLLDENGNHAATYNCPGLVVNIFRDGQVVQALDPEDLEFTGKPQLDAQPGQKIDLSFSHNVYNNFSVDYVPWGTAQRKTLSPADYAHPHRFAPAAENAHYIVDASFRMEDGLFLEVTYKFDVAH